MFKIVAKSTRNTVFKLIRTKLKILRLVSNK